MSYVLAKWRGNNPNYDVVEQTPSGGFRIGTVYPIFLGEGWSGACSYAVAKGHVYKGNLLGNPTAVRFATMEEAGAAVFAEKCRRTEGGR